mmetsp:Transcript_42347/g.122489  ORF Transcript_42347/g.122489 Transcript_42347/m.122489 type:complete len:100 (-) Transcript_42347:2-301(-)
MALRGGSRDSGRGAAEDVAPRSMEGGRGGASAASREISGATGQSSAAAAGPTAAVEEEARGPGGPIGRRGSGGHCGHPSAAQAHEFPMAPTRLTSKEGT